MIESAQNSTAAKGVRFHACLSCTSNLLWLTLFLGFWCFRPFCWQTLHFWEHVSLNLVCQCVLRNLAIGNNLFETLSIKWRPFVALFCGGMLQWASYPTEESNFTNIHSGKQESNGKALFMYIVRNLEAFPKSGRQLLSKAACASSWASGHIAERANPTTSWYLMAEHDAFLYQDDSNTSRGLPKGLYCCKSFVCSHNRERIRMNSSHCSLQGSKAKLFTRWLHIHNLASKTKWMPDAALVASTWLHGAMGYHWLPSLSLAHVCALCLSNVAGHHHLLHLPGMERHVGKSAARNHLELIQTSFL